MSWPAPTRLRASHARLIGGPDDRKIIALVGAYRPATPAIFANGYIGTVGHYQWDRLPSGEYVGRFARAAL